MNEVIAKVHISLTDGVLQIEGSETFVAEQLSKLEPHIVRAFDHNPSDKKGGNKKTDAKGSTDPSINLAAFDHLFAEANGKIQLLKSPPGNNNAQKMVNTALLLSFANSLLGNTITPTDGVREICKAHACLDASNFAKRLKDEKELFLIEGTGRSKDIKLTVPGKKKAEELAKSLNAV